MSLAERGVAEVDLETGSNFEENATLKAQGYASMSRLTTLADDSGLEVDALGGRPGVYSARYGGRTTDQGRIELLLSELQRVPWESRTARFRCVIAVNPGLKGGSDVILCSGECPGIICLEPRGSNGFGYDPVFYLPDLGKTMAELAFEEKNRVSHRARAARGVRPGLEELFRRRTGNERAL